MSDKGGWVGSNYYSDFQSDRTKGMFRASGADTEGYAERMYMREIMELCMNRFKWENLPDSIDHRFLELVLFQDALAVFFETDFGTPEALRASGAGYLNMYENPTSFRVYGNQFFSRELKYHKNPKLSECVPIWGNYSRIADTDIVTYYAKRLARLDRTIDINVLTARTPFVLEADDNTSLTLDNIYKQIADGADVIKVRSGTMGSVGVHDIGKDPKLFEHLHVLRARLWNECMGLLGIENANQEKKERLVEGEVDANKEQTNLARGINLNARQEACEEINRKYGLDLWVEYRGELPDMGLPGTELEDEMEGGE